MKNNYPIRFVNIPVYEENNYHDSKIVYYISVKCYLIGEKTQFLSDGNSVKTYEVVPFYERINQTDFKSQEPIYDKEAKKYTNSVEVDDVFLSYDSAVKARNKKINELLYRQMADKGRNERLIELEFHNIEEQCESIQGTMNANNWDIPVSMIVAPQKTIILDSNKSSAMEVSIYDVINLLSNHKFVVRTVTKEEFTELYNSSRNLEPLKADAGSVLLVNNPEENVVKITNGVLVNYLKDGKLNQQAGANLSFDQDEAIILYTTETFEEFCKSFKPEEVIKLERKFTLN